MKRLTAPSYHCVERVSRIASGMRQTRRFSLAPVAHKGAKRRAGAVSCGAPMSKARRGFSLMFKI
jgi:hypothetical protein